MRCRKRLGDIRHAPMRWLLRMAVLALGVADCLADQRNVKLDLSDVPSAATAAVLKQLLCNERPREAQPTIITNQTHIQEGLDNERERREAERVAAMENVEGRGVTSPDLARNSPPHLVLTVLTAGLTVYGCLMAFVIFVSYVKTKQQHARQRLEEIALFGHGPYDEDQDLDDGEMPPGASLMWLSWPLRWVEYFSHPNDLLAFRVDYDDLQTDVLTRAEYIRQYRRRILRMQLIVDIRRWRSRLRLNQQDADEAEARLTAESAAAAEARESARMVRHQEALAEAAAAARERAETTIASSGQTYAERRAARASRNAATSRGAVDTAETSMPAVPAIARYNNAQPSGGGGEAHWVAGSGPPPPFAATADLQSRPVHFPDVEAPVEPVQGCEAAAAEVEASAPMDAAATVAATAATQAGEVVDAGGGGDEAQAQTTRGAEELLRVMGIDSQRHTAGVVRLDQEHLVQKVLPRFPHLQAAIHGTVPTPSAAPASPSASPLPSVSALLSNFTHDQLKELLPRYPHLQAHLTGATDASAAAVATVQRPPVATVLPSLSPHEAWSVQSAAAGGDAEAGVHADSQPTHAPSLQRQKVSRQSTVSEICEEPEEEAGEVDLLAASRRFQGVKTELTDMIQELASTLHSTGATLEPAQLDRVLCQTPTSSRSAAFAGGDGEVTGGTRPPAVATAAQARRAARKSWLAAGCLVSRE